MFDASEEATSGSVMQNAERICPSSNGCSHSFCWAGVPNAASSSMLPVSGAAQFIASGASAGLRPDSSASGAYCRLVRPAPNALSGRNRFHRPRRFASAFSSSTTGGRSHGSASAATWCAKTGSAGYTHSSRKAWTRPTYSVVTASGAKSIGVLLSECGVPAGQQFRYHGADLAEPLADGQPLGVPAVDAFEDHGEREVGEGDVPVEVADRDPAGRRVPLDQVGAGRPAGQAAGRGRRG